MKPERWQQVRKVFEAAVERSAAERAAFLDQACAGDVDLRAEVDSLLQSHQSSGEFLEKPAYEAAAHLLADETPRSLTGRQLGPYLLTEKIGQGGMGIVYLAKDSRLDRLVAIKVLAPDFTRDSRHRERLRREARAAAKLSDPGIAVVYSLEEYDDNLCLIREYVRGKTLFEELKNGPLSIDIVLDVAIKVARALAVAHESGVVHRDLKPENIVRAADRSIKILDFGLARIVGPAETAGSVRLTGAGTMVGTPAYSSPEQLLGQEVDFRTDIFSFGVLLFELASGVHPFAGTDPISLMAHILESEPPNLRAMAAHVPPAFGAVVRRCLEKKPTNRYSSARELLHELEGICRQPQAEAGASVCPPAAVPPRIPARSNLLWWWQFHQACVAIIYYLMLYPLWLLHEWTKGPLGSIFFFPALVAVGISANLRFHLWFTSATYPAELAPQRQRAARWVRFGDILFVGTLFAAAAANHSAHAVMATLLVTAGIGSLVGFLLIEPTTARAVFGDGS